MKRLRDWLLGTPETPLEASLRHGSPCVGPCRHGGSRIAPDPEEADGYLWTSEARP